LQNLSQNHQKDFSFLAAFSNLPCCLKCTVGSHFPPDNKSVMHRNQSFLKDTEKKQVELLI